MYRYIVQRSYGRWSTNFLRGYAASARPPQMREAGFGKIIVILTPFVIGGGVVSYANYDKEFRQILESNVPGSAPVLKVLLQEEDLIGDVKRKVDSVTSSVTGFFGSSEPTPKKEEAKKVPTPISNMVQRDAAKAAPAMPELKAPSQAKSTSAPVVSKEIPKAPTPELPKDISDLSKLAESSANLAVREYQKAVAILSNYTAEVKKIVEDAGEKLDTSAWTTLKNKTSARDSAVKTAENAAAEARNAIENIEKALYKSEFAADLKEPLKQKVRNFLDSLDTAKKTVYEAYEHSDLSEKYWRNIESARNHFIKDIEELFPNVNFAEKKLNLSKEEVDLFLVYAHTQYLTVQKELQKLHTEGEVRLRRAIDAVRGGDDSVANKAEVAFEMEKLRREIETENAKKLFRMQHEKEKELSDMLKKQLDAHVDHINEKLQLKEQEMRRKFDRELTEKLSTENASYKTDLASMIGKLKGMDAALKARAATERSAQQAQHLWGACQALWASVRAGEPGVKWTENLRPLGNEIKAVEYAAEGDELVAAVIAGLPREAIKRGVYPEDALRERFIRVDHVARRLASVPEGGARLPIYILSYIQSMLIITPSNPISKDELQDKPVDFAKFDNYDILNRAKYWIERGNLTQALKYMNLLRGAARDVASEWMSEARLLLETQQAANTLMAHAAANSQRYL